MLEKLKEHLRGLCGYNKRGEEIPDSTPVALPVGFTRPKTLQQTMRELLRNEEFLRAQEAAEVESFDEADDFDVGEQDPLDGTPYEDCFDPDRPGAIAREQELRAGYVEDIRPEKKAHAKEVIERHKKKPPEGEPPKGEKG